MNHSRVNADLTVSPSGSRSNHILAIPQARCLVNLAPRLASVYTDFTLLNTMMMSQDARFGSQLCRDERGLSAHPRSDLELGPEGNT